MISIGWCVNALNHKNRSLKKETTTSWFLCYIHVYDGRLVVGGVMFFNNLWTLIYLLFLSAHHLKALTFFLFNCFSMNEPWRVGGRRILCFTGLVDVTATLLYTALLVQPKRHIYVETQSCWINFFEKCVISWFLLLFDFIGVQFCLIFIILFILL
jgi:hypothetical protein